MKSTSPMTFGLALALAASATLAIAPAAAKKEAKQAKQQVSKPVLDALNAAQTALQANDMATVDANIATAAAAATTPSDRFFVSQAQLSAATKINNPARQAAAIDAMLATGLAPAEMQPKLYRNAAVFAYQAKNYAKAEDMFTRAAALSPNDPDLLVSLAEVQFQNKHYPAGFATTEKAIAAKKPSGAAPESWYKRPLAVAYQAKLPAESFKWGQTLVQAYPNAVNWRTVLTLFRDNIKLDDQQMLDLFRLQRAAGALAGERDYYEYANTAFLRGLPGEAKTVADQGLAAVTKSKALTEVKTLASGKTAADRAALPGLETRARSAADARSAMSTGDAYLGYGDYAKAADLFRVALQKPGVDADTANTRLGVALALSGRKADAAKAFSAVSTAGVRGQIAGYWKIWLGA